MATHKPFTEIRTLPANANGERTILEAHLDAAHDSLATVIEYLTQAVWSAGGVVIPGSVTNPEAAIVRVQGRLGVTADARTLVAVGDQSVDLAGVATGTRCLVVIQAKAGSITSHNFVDSVTGESITHSLLSAWGKVEVIAGDSSVYPSLPPDCVPVAQVTKTGASSLTLDAVVTTPPVARSGGGGGGDTSGLVPKLASVRSYSANAILHEDDDLAAYVRVTAAATITLPDGFPVGWQCVIVNATASSAVALAAQTTLTLPAGFEPAVQNRRAVTVIHVGAGVWEVHGALVEVP